jgi:adenylate cyclase
MPENRRPGKLAVILHADVAGSTSLVQQDEHLAHERIRESFRRFGDTITRYHGHVRELRGDALLAEFERASDAVAAALAFQADQAEYTAQLNDNIRPIVRVGIALGEVIVADNTVTGAGVVLAQRVEQLAEHGGVCITGAIHEALPQRMPFIQASLGEQEVKGFTEPVRVYRVALRSGEVIPPPEEIPQRKASNTLGISAAVAAIVLVVAGGVAFWFQPWVPKEEPVSVERMAFPLPEKPSIAVLPFDNLSGDEDQDFLADGITENIITILAKSPQLFIIARNSTFTYKGKAVSVKQVAEELGVRHVLEGSVQREGERIRITAQLIDGLSGRHIWAERYDREFKDIFSLQDDIAENILIAMRVEMAEGEDFRVMHTRIRSPKAFELLMKARASYLQYSKESNATGLQLIQKARGIEPDNPEIWMYEALAHFRNHRFWWSDDRKASFNSALELAEKAYAADPHYSATNGLLGVINLGRGDYDKAVAFARKSVELSPNSAIDKATFAWILCYSGYPEEAIPQLHQAMRLSPYYPPWFVATLGLAYLMTEDYDNAIAAHEQLIERESMLPFAYSRLAGIHATLGNKEKAQEYAEELLKISPKFTIQSWAKRLIYQNPQDLERELKMLRLAGLPEGGDG